MWNRTNVHSIAPSRSGSPSSPAQEHARKVLAMAAPRPSSWGPMGRAGSLSGAPGAGVEGWAEGRGEMIVQEGGEATVCVCDVSRDEDCRGAVAQAVDQWGRVDILVNNVG